MHKLAPFLGILILASSASLAQHSSKPTHPKPVLYAQVAPIFAKNCVACHQGPNPGHGLTLSSFASITKGDRVGRVVVPGSAVKSRLVTVLHGKPETMPPTADLPKSQIALIEAWIKSGARQK
jgi:mono/diheme cytochrome c family protein